jgi:hypothetical protein
MPASMACSPLAAYLGTQGDCLQLALRPGTQHSAFETPYDLEPLLPLAQRLCAGPLLVRADSGFCGQPILASVAQQARALGRRIAVLIKWNPRLPAPITAAQVIELYCQHATHEQFHAEFKTDMGLERLPSGKFDPRTGSARWPAWRWPCCA